MLYQDPPAPGRRCRRSSISRCRSSAETCRASSALCLRSAVAAADRWPSFHRARRQRSSPAAVRGPVEAPPCSLQRVWFPVLVLRIAGALHGVPLLVLAPHRGAFGGSPPGLPFSRRPEFLLLAMLSTLQTNGTYEASEQLIAAVLQHRDLVFPMSTLRATTTPSIGASITVWFRLTCTTSTAAFPCAACAWLTCERLACACVLAWAACCFWALVSASAASALGDSWPSRSRLH